jgi:Uma2 family endonuclease
MSAVKRPKVPAIRMTFDEFMDWADEDTLSEWVDGTVEMTSPASLRHQEVATFLHHVLGRYVALGQLGKLILAPFVMHLPNVPPGREPDVIFVATDHLDRLQPPARPTRLEGPADLVVEVVSPESTMRGREKKFGEYAQGGVPEYWIVDLVANEVRFFQLDAQGTYQSVASDAEGIYRSRAVPGFWLRVEWLWRDPLPDVDEALREIAAPAAARDLAERASDAYVRALLDELRRLGKLPDDHRE